MLDLSFGTPWRFFFRCQVKARNGVVGEVLCVKNIKWLVALRQKTGVLAWLAYIISS